ncbi:MAG: tRNA threonylcarbamoyladenosine dehydratase [Anaerolineaceae bacterium]|nr:tRNA threonylcarbamoyladenosine dehydratase [Anaerolineaceae bacterium]
MSNDPAIDNDISTKTGSESAVDRLRLILGETALSRLQKSRVMVIGLGGVGSSCAEALARGGIGSLVLVDRDVVTPSNINRQALAFHSTIGRPKTEVMKQMIKDINPECETFTLQAFIDKDQIPEQLGSLPHPDFVVDAIDTISQKLAIAIWCQEEGIPEVSAMGGANKLDPTRLRFAPIEETHTDPLARVMRKEGRKRGLRELTVLYSDELPREAEGKHSAIDEKGFVKEGASILGTMSYYPPIMGQMLAGYVLCKLAGLQ